MRVIIHPDYNDLTDFIKQLPETFFHTGELLYEGRNTVKRYHVGGHTLVVKRYKHPNIYQRVTYTFFKQSKTERAYRFAARMRELGIDTPHEVAFIETKRRGLFTIGYFVSLNCDYPPVSTTMAANEFTPPLAESLARFLVELHEKGILHGDLNPTNILYHTDDTGQYRFSLIDTNRSKFKRPTRDDCLKNLKRLTHRRELLTYITTLYARLRGWDVDRCVKQEMGYLDRYENKENFKFGLQKLLGIHHPRRVSY